MKRLFLSILTLAVVLGAFASDWRQVKINSIKKDNHYLYGEATMPTLEDATSLAYERLQNEVFAWIQSDSITIKDINRLSDTIMTRRVNMYRVFIYIEKSKLKPYTAGAIQVDTTQVDTIHVDKVKADTVPKKPVVKQPIIKKDSTLLTDSVRQMIQQRFFSPKAKKAHRQSDALQRIKKAKNFFELKEIMQPLKDNGDILDYGKYATAQHPESCYLIVYDPAGNIRALLGKGEEERPNLKTGRKDTLKNYRGCGAIWFTLKE